MEFKQYKRKSVSEMRPITGDDVKHFKLYGHIDANHKDGHPITPHAKVSISEEDIKAGSPKLGDMIARNPKNYEDQWLVAKAYFEDNLESAEQEPQVDMTFKERLEIERKELQEKVTKLGQFIGNEKFTTIDSDQQSFLLIQERAMFTYLQCLEARLTRL